MHQNKFRLGLRPRPYWGSLRAPPDPTAGFKGPTSKGREGKGMEGKEKDGRKGEGREKGGEEPTSKGKGRKEGERERGEGMIITVMMTS